MGRKEPTRTITTFLFLPLTLRVSGTRRSERRWLRFAQIVQRYTCIGKDECGLVAMGWVSVAFAKKRHKCEQL